MRQLLEVFPLSIYAAVSISIFLSIFLIIVVRTFVESKESIQRKARIPLEDESEEGVK